ncbi:hypothetical protein [Alistipes sp. ZOR0009]|uniref:hypothetical protein n=1 Tax=Alistipes sp. ZOR0009 TaxID=1339253 RepID=UPI000646F3DC|nr:hypothetical protein [Alistipes sp. ZOR0009]
MRILSISIFLLWVSPLLAQQRGIDHQKAKQYFEEAKQICQKDAGSTWGASLDGPILFVDQNTREVVANSNDSLQSLTLAGGLYCGSYPDSLPIANTSVRWNGTTWTMVIWQALSNNPAERNRLIMHESWHSKQQALGFPSCGSKNGHLAELEGRLLLKMEWLALSEAIQPNHIDTSHLANALMFRFYRQARFDASKKESVFEMHEGLAEYTGQRLSGANEAECVSNLKKMVTSALEGHNLLMSFAYTSGALYGYILDKLQPGWTKGLTKNDDFGLLLAKSIGTTPVAAKGKVERLKLTYDKYNLIKKETAYENERQNFLKECKKRFVKGAKLVIPMKITQISFNPHGVIPWGSHGTIYKELNCFGEWGRLSTEKGGLITPNWTSVILDAPTSGTSEFWTITLNDGWKIVKLDNGDYTIEKR